MCVFHCALFPLYYLLQWICMTCHNEAETKWPPFSRRHFQTDFFNKNIWISIKILLKFVPMGPISNIPTLVQMMAWRRPMSNRTVFSIITGRVSVCMIVTWFEMVIFIKRRLTSECKYKCAKDEKDDWSGLVMVNQKKISESHERYFKYFQCLILTLSQIWLSCGEKRWHYQGDCIQLAGSVYAENGSCNYQWSKLSWPGTLNFQRWYQFMCKYSTSW